MNMDILALFDIDNTLIESSAGADEVFPSMADIDHILKFILNR
jgi:hypothetical protein